MTKKSHLPDIAIFLNPSENLGAIRECTAKNVPTVGIVDSDTDPRIVTYPIPANMEVSHTILGPYEPIERYLHLRFKASRSGAGLRWISEAGSKP